MPSSSLRVLPARRRRPLPDQRGAAMPFYPPNVQETFPERRVRDDPFRELEELNDRIGTLLGRTLGEERGLRVSEGFAPLVDIEETDESWVFEADLPGVKGED